MKIDIIGSGSSGNCIILDGEVMIDAGVPYSKIGNISGLHTVLLTHIHGDHFNPATIRKITVNTEAKFLCGDFLTDDLTAIGVPKDRISKMKAEDIISRNVWLFCPVNLYHDVPNFGWRIMHNGHKHFHATDTAHLEGITARNYDSATIECNHHLPTALELIERAEVEGEFTHLKGAINSHLSVDQAIKFVKDNNIKRFEPCHIGNSTRPQVLRALLEAFPEKGENNAA